MTFSGLINRVPRYYRERTKLQFAWELDLFRTFRQFSDGITLFELTSTIDLFEGDHNPQAGFLLAILNYKICEFNIYNIFHMAEDFSVE